MTVYLQLEPGSWQGPGQFRLGSRLPSVLGWAGLGLQALLCVCSELRCFSPRLLFALALTHSNDFLLRDHHGHPPDRGLASLLSHQLEQGVQGHLVQNLFP